VEDIIAPEQLREIFANDQKSPAAPCRSRQQAPRISRGPETMTFTIQTQILSHSGAEAMLARISHIKQAHRGSESAKVAVLQRLSSDSRKNPDADRV
jgi:hypothetical protein